MTRPRPIANTTEALSINSFFDISREDSVAQAAFSSMARDAQVRIAQIANVLAVGIAADGATNANAANNAGKDLYDTLTFTAFEALYARKNLTFPSSRKLLQTLPALIDLTKSQVGAIPYPLQP